MYIYVVFRSVIALGVCVGILGVAVVGLGWCMHRMNKRMNKEMKRKLSDENIVYYNPAQESAEILEGVDHLEQLKRRVLVERLESGIDREVEDLGFMTNDADEFSFTHNYQKQTVHKEVACS